MYKFMMVVIAVCFLFSINVYAAEETENKNILAEVNGEKTTVADFNKELADVPQNYREALMKNKQRLLDELVLRELLYQEALKQELDKDAEVLEVLERTKKKLMAQKLVIDIANQTELTDEELENYYEANKDMFQDQEQIEASHILIKVNNPKDEEESKAAKVEIDEIAGKIKKGEDFEELAKQHSQCPSSAKGGNLGYFPRGSMVPEFENAAFDLRVGEVSEPVKTDFGYHIIKLNAKKAARKKPYEEVKDEAGNKLLREKRKQAIDQYTGKLKENAKITVNEEALK